MVKKKPICHFKQMDYHAGESDGCGHFEEWFQCSVCGHTLDYNDAILEKEELKDE